MKLSLESIRNRQQWQGYRLPALEPAQIAEHTQEEPCWLHFGAGNIFRAFPAVLCQNLIEEGKLSTGIICCESYDEEIVTKSLRPYDNLSIAVTMNADGSIDKQIVASIAESLILSQDIERLRCIFGQPSLQLVSFTITEKGYAIRNAQQALLPEVAADIQSGPQHCSSFMAQLTALCLERRAACGKPLALVSMDNCSHNGEKLQQAVMEIARGWLANGQITQQDYAYLQTEITFPWTMIDKITPRPDPGVEKKLLADGLEEISPFITSKHTYTAPFVNAEKTQYLVIEDAFPNGRPMLEETGVIMTTRATVNQVEKMKVSTCLNPLHTCLAIYGCLLGYSSIADEMKDPELSKFVRRMSYEEGMPFVADPGVIEPRQFLEEVLTQRLPNPYMPDTPQRIATDTSQKLAVRFGETIKAWQASSEQRVPQLRFIPLVLAGWLRYLLGVDDAGNSFEVSPDPLMPMLKEALSGISIGQSYKERDLQKILMNESIFGVNLIAAGLDEQILQYFKELTAGPGAVRQTLKKYLD